MTARFDWYQATVRAELSPLRSALLGVCDGAGEWESMERAPHGYGGGQRLRDADGQVAMIWFGGMHAHPHVVSSGESAQRVAEVLRGQYAGAHGVTRADACLDYAEPGAYDRLQELALGVAKDCRIKVGTAGDHLLTMEGRTLYLGAASSHTRLRLYDKAAELRHKFAGDIRCAAVPAELARFEVQVRPKTPEAKATAAELSPMELMGSAAWTRELVRRAFALELEPFQAGASWRQSDDSRAYAALLGQYGGLLKRVLADLGTWDMVGRQIGDDLARLEVERARAGRVSRR